MAQAYENALPGSREHHFRLVEIVAASLHAFAGILYKSSHPQTDIKPPKPREGHFYQFRDTDHFYVDFYHTNYKLLERYPFGLLNVIGYWAEAELLGGVLLFERGSSSSEVVCTHQMLATPNADEFRSSTLSSTRKDNTMHSSFPNDSFHPSQIWAKQVVILEALIRKASSRLPKNIMLPRSLPLLWLEMHHFVSTRIIMTSSRLRTSQNSQAA